jgi:hypothetical protein
MKNKEDVASTLSESKWAWQTVADLPAGPGAIGGEAYPARTGRKPAGTSKSATEPSVESSTAPEIEV